MAKRILGEVVIEETVEVGVPCLKSNQGLSRRIILSKLNKEEKEILQSFEAGEFKSVLTTKQRKALQAAAGTFKKNKRINIRISERDLNALQRRALEEGIPYQTLVSSILHKYISGGLQYILAKKTPRSDRDKRR